MKIILRIVGLETGYAERIRKCQEKVHVYERLCKASAKANKLVWPGYAERSRKCHEKVHVYEWFESQTIQP